MQGSVENYATGWSQASRVGQAAAYKSFLIEPLPLREVTRSKAKEHVSLPRERNADEDLDPEIKEVRVANLVGQQRTKNSRRMSDGSTSLDRTTLRSQNGRHRRWRSTAQPCLSSNRFHCQRWHSRQSGRFATFIPPTGLDMLRCHSRMHKKLL